MSYDDIVMLKETLQIIDQGCYEHEGKEVKLKLSDNERSEAQVYLPDRVAEICGSRDADLAVENECVYDCANMDSYTYARKIYAERKKEERVIKTEILVLNFANPVNPGGGVRTGARAQEEDLCRKSTLLVSLESVAAQEYYRYNRSLQSYMGSEIAIDVLAAKMGIDPFDMREMNCYKESEGTTIPTGYPPEVYCEEALFKTARPLYEAAKKRVAEKNAASDGKIKYGIGVSLGVYGCGLDGVDTSNAFAELNPDGTVTMYAAWEDHGQGADMGVLVSSHETLRQAGIRPEQIKLVMNDTKTCPNAGPAGGSRSQVMSGNACRLAAENLVAAMKKEDGTFRTYDEMVAEGLATKYEGNWVTTFCADHPIDQDTAQGDPFATYMYTIFLPEVAVNTETGKVTVEKFTCVADVGTIMNRLLVEGNFYGGLVQGIGLALTEDFEDLNHDTSLKNCGIPYPNDAPDDIELHFNETYRPSGPYGAAGCGEAPLDAPHPAILNAIYNATGARITRVPARPERVLAALKELEK